MSQPSGNLPFAYRLPSDVAARIHGTAVADVPLVERGSPRRRLVLLVLVLGLLGAGLAAGLPSGGTQTLRGDDCRPGSDVDAAGQGARTDPWLC